MNIFKLMQAMRPYIQRGDMTYDLAVKYLKERGVQFDGIVKKALDNMFKKIKARDPVFDKSVTKMPIDDAGTPFNPNTLKSTTEKRGVENLFKETKRVNIPAEKLNHQKIADQAGIDIELIKGKDWVEILEVLKGLKKADGGRIGFNQGGWSPGAGRDDRGYKSDHPSHGGGGGGNKNKSVYIPPVIKDAGKTGIINLGLNKLGMGKYVHPAMLMKGIYDRYKNQPVKDEDLILSNDPFAGIEGHRADLSKGQMKALNNPTHKFNIQEMGDYGILNDAGFKAQEIEGAPATKEDIDSYYAGTYVGADGGRVNFEVGGLSEQAQGIYDSWISAGHSEEDVLAYLESRGLYNAPVIQEGIMTAPNIINQNLGGDGGGSNISPNYGTYQKEYTGMTMPDGTPIMSGLTKQKGPGFIEGLLELYENIPTPLNLVKRGINKFQDWRTQQNQVAIDIQKKAEAERILKEKIAAAEAAAASARAGASGRRPGSGGQGIATDSTGTSYDAGGRQGYGYGLKDGGLATMFTRRR